MKNNTLILLALAGIGFYLLTRRKTGTTATTPPPAQTKTLPAGQAPTMGGYYSSFLPGARPESPFQVRWGDGNNFEDTTKKARLVV